VSKTDASEKNSPVKSCVIKKKLKPDMKKSENVGARSKLCEWGNQPVENRKRAVSRYVHCKNTKGHQSSTSEAKHRGTEN
jgi:hypothetical protein